MKRNEVSVCGVLGARGAVVIGWGMISKRLGQSKQERRPTRSLGEIVDSLPHRKLGRSPTMPMEGLPNDVLPELELPRHIDVEVASGKRRSS